MQNTLTNRETRIKTKYNEKILNYLKYLNLPHQNGQVSKKQAFETCFLSKYENRAALIILCPANRFSLKF